MSKATKRVAAYIRVSTVGQNEAGQRAEVRRWLEGNGVTADSVRWYVDKQTGDNLNRPAFQRLQKAIFNGDVATVVIWRLDRLSRTVRDGLAVLCDWCDKGLRLVSVSQQIDFNGTVGKIIASVLFGVAEMEQQTRRERQAAGIAQAKKEGKYKGRKPGTFKSKSGPARAKQLAAKGLTKAEIAAALGVSRPAVYRYLKAAEVTRAKRK
jgi:DNA invertase Pin-like site-specific DNA recombinase